MKQSILLFIFVICIGLLAQRKPFDPDYYRDTLKVKKSDEYKKLESYREKYKNLEFPLTGVGEAYGYPTYYADLFNFRGINLDRIEEYKKLGFFVSNYQDDIFRDLHNKIFRPIIVIAKLISFERALRDDIAFFKVLKIIKGREYYNEFPSSIKCYSIDTEGTYRDKIKDGKNVTEIIKPVYFSKWGPETGDEFILFLDEFIIDEDYLFIKYGDKNEYDRSDVFYGVKGDYLGSGKFNNVELSDILNKLKLIEDLSKEK